MKNRKLLIDGVWIGLLVLINLVFVYNFLKIRLLMPYPIENFSNPEKVMTYMQASLFLHVFVKFVYIICIVFWLMPRQSNLKYLEIFFFTELFVFLESGVFLWISETLIDDSFSFLIYQFSLPDIFFVYCFLFLLAIGIYYMRMALINLPELKKLFNKQAELRRIKAQNEPHFLFNSLNSLYALSVTKDQPEISRGIERLTANLRYVYKNRDRKLVCIEEEIRNIEDYIDLQTVRIDSSKVSIKYKNSAEDVLQKFQIPPLSLMNFVENAFQHGISYQAESFIEISLSRVERGVKFNILNSNHSKNKVDGEGIRLSESMLKASLGKKKYSLEIDRGRNIFNVNLLLKK